MFGAFGQLLVVSVVGIALSLAMPAHRLDAAMQSEQPQVLAAFTSHPGLPDPNEIFNAMNITRGKHGLGPLQRDPALTKIAETRASDMQKHTYYAHKSPKGLFYYDLLTQDQVVTGYSCENLNLSFTANPTSYISDWMNSNKGHRQCLLHATTNRAGYAVTSINTGEHTGNDVPTYVVVAIHAQID